VGDFGAPIMKPLVSRIGEMFTETLIFAVLLPPHRFEMINSFAGADAGHNVGLLVGALWRQNNGIDLPTILAVE
jgi:hypothetical protein